MKTFSNWSWSIRVSSVVIQRCVRKGQGIVQIDRHKMELLNIRSKTIKKQGNNGLREDQVIVRATSQFSILAELWDSLHPSARPTVWSNWYHVSQRHTLFSDSPVPACRASRLKSMILWWTCRSWSRNDALRYIDTQWHSNIPRYSKCMIRVRLDSQTVSDLTYRILSCQKIFRSSRPWSPASPAQAQAQENPKRTHENKAEKQKSRTQYTEIQKHPKIPKAISAKQGNVVFPI